MEKAKVGLIVSIVLVIILAVSNIWFYVTLKDEIQILHNEKNSFQSQVNILHTQKNSLNATCQLLHEQKNSLNATCQEYMSTHSRSDSEYDSLQSEYDNYRYTHHYSDSEYNTIKDERDSLKAPKLSTLSLHYADDRPWLGTPHLHVYGEVWNVGTDTAYNCKLHVMAYQGSVKAIDTYVHLGTISGENRKSVDENVYYSGEALTSWIAIPEWTS